LSPVGALRVLVNHVNANPNKPKSTTLDQKVFGTKINQTWLRQFPIEDSLEFRGVPPGRYVLDIASSDGSGSHRSMLLNLTEDAEVDPESAPAVSPIRGVVQMQGGVSLTDQAHVKLWNSRSDEVLDSSVSDKGEINFGPDPLTPGTYSVYAMNGANSIVANLKATGARVTGQTIEITGGKPVQLEIEMSTTLSKINGTTRRDGKPVAGAMILLVPEDSEVNLPKFRRDQSDSDGTFTLIDVLPGRYRVLAIDDGWDLEWANLSLLKKRLDHAQKIEVQPSKTYQITIDVE
jgi:hypothetical protein